MTGVPYPPNPPENPPHPFIPGSPGWLAYERGRAAADSWWRSRLESDEAHVVVHQAILEAANRGDHITTQAVEVLRALRASLLPVNEPETATPIPDSEFVEPPLMPSDPISERMIDVADDAFRSGSSGEQVWRECLGDALYAVYPLIRERVIAEASQGKRPANPKPETDT